MSEPMSPPPIRPTIFFPSSHSSSLKIEAADFIETFLLSYETDYFTFKYSPQHLTVHDHYFVSHATESNQRFRAELNRAHFRITYSTSTCSPAELLLLILSLYFIFCKEHVTRSRDSSVGIATGYGLDDRWVRVQVPVGSRIFTSPRRPDRL
jgi:hypothetical protein